MAVRIDAAGDRLVRTSGLLNYNAAYTIMGWFYFTSLPTTRYSTAFALEDGSVSNLDYFQVDQSATHHVEWGQEVNSSFAFRAGTTVITTATWYHIALVRASATSLQGYLNGLAEGAAVTTNIGARAADTRMESGGIGAGNADWLDGRIAYLKAWDRALSADEVLNEMRAIRPMHASSLWGFWPAWPNQRAKDLSGSARDWTESGTLTDEDPPAVAFGAWPWIIVGQPAAGGGDATLTAAVATATALSPVASVTAGAALAALAATATALSPTATVSAGAVMAAPVGTATALGPIAAVTAGALFAAPVSTATALSPTGTLSAASAGTLTALVATATALSPISALTAGALLTASLSTATALAPTAAVAAGALLGASAATASALAPSAGLAAGAQMTAAVSLATALALGATLNASALLVAQRAAATARSPIATITSGMLALVLRRTLTGAPLKRHTLTGAPLVRHTLSGVPV